MHGLIMERPMRTGGNVIGSGGFGCVFQPMLQCSNQSRKTKRSADYVSKLMTKDNARKEFEEIEAFRTIVRTIPRYEEYFLVNNIQLCDPAPLTSSDLTRYTEECSALPKINITRQNINHKLNELMLLNLPFGGVAIDEYLYQKGSFTKLYRVHTRLVDLLQHGILPMNAIHAYHSDIKDSNVLILDTRKTAMLIDWGLSTTYSGGKKIPERWTDRPLQFNVPCTIILFTNLFPEMYAQHNQMYGVKKELRLFAEMYLKMWIQKRGEGHYRFINELMAMVYDYTNGTVPREEVLKTVEIQFTVPFFIDSIVSALERFTDNHGVMHPDTFAKQVFAKNIDIVGFVSCYIPFLESLYNNITLLTKTQKSLLDALRILFGSFVFSPSAKPISITKLKNTLKFIGGFIRKEANMEKPKITRKRHSKKKQPIVHPKASTTLIFTRRRTYTPSTV